MQTIRSRIEAHAEALTASERKVASVLLANYPFAGLDTIQTLAERSQVSAPSITRLIHKLGCNGYQEFQRCLISELEQGQRSPIDLRRDSSAPGEGFLREFAGRAAAICAATADTVSQAQFDTVCDLVSDEARAVFVIGGRMSDAIALLLSRHLRQIRPRVSHISADPEQWPGYLLRMRTRDVVVMVDFRRYQSSLEQLAQRAARERGASVVLITDKWISPISRHCAEVMAAPIESGTAWDSYAGALALVEAIIVRVSERDWDATRERIESWDRLRFYQGDE